MAAPSIGHRAHADASLPLSIHFHPGHAAHAFSLSPAGLLHFQPTTISDSAAPTFAALVAAPAVSLTQSQVDALKTGFSSEFSSLDASIAAQVFAETLPIVGNNLADAAASGAASLHYVGDLKTAIVSGLSTLNGSASYSEAQVESAINGALGAAGISGAGANLDLSDSANVKLGFTTLKSYGGAFRAGGS